MSEATESITAHPDYAEGYWDAMSGEPLFDDCSFHYGAGWRAAWRAKGILREGGFSETRPGQFSAKWTLKGGEGHD